MDERLKEVLDRFAEDASTGLKALLGLLSEDRPAFHAAALVALRARMDAPGDEALARLLAEKDLLTEALCDPAVFTKDRAIEIARVAVLAQPILDSKLAHQLPDLEPERAEHVLAILDVIAEGSRVAPMLRYLARDSNPRLRSKAALLVGRANRKPEWLEQQMRDADPRMRANAIEALWTVDAPAVRVQLCLAMDDPYLRVSSNALVGLYKLGDLSCIPRLRQQASHPSSPQRASAAWAMGETGDPRFLPTLREMNPDPVDKVARNITRAIERIDLAQGQRQGRLTVHLLHREVQSDGSVRLEIAIAPQEGDLIDLQPTEFILWEGPRAVEADSITHRARSHALVLGFALCGGVDLADADLEEARSAVLACLERKRPSDSWTIVRHIDELIRYLPDKIALRKILQAAPATRFQSAGKTDVLSKLAERAGVVRGDHHVIVLAGQQGIPGGILPNGQPDPDQIVAAARQHKCAIHTIVLGGSEGAHAIEGLASQTGGMKLRAGSSGELEDIYRQVCCGLLNRYELSYRPADSALPVRVEVCASQSRGELLLD
jgi:hypothetical protein